MGWISISTHGVVQGGYSQWHGVWFPPQKGAARNMGWSSDQRLSFGSLTSLQENIRGVLQQRVWFCLPQKESKTSVWTEQPCELCGKGNDGGLLPKCTTAPNQNTHLTWPTFTERERGQPTSLQNTECPLKPQWWGFLPKTMSSGFPPLPAGVWTWFSVWVPSNSDILWFHDFGIKLHWRKVVLSPCFGPWLEAVEVSSCHSTSHQLYCIVIIS